MKKIVFFSGCILLFNCTGDDACFSKKGDEVSEVAQIAAFHTIDIPMNVSAEIIPSDTYKLEIHSFENRIQALSYSVKDSVLLISNEISCEMLKSTETALLKIHTPTLKRIHSRTQFQVYSNTVLTYPNLYLLTSIPKVESASTHFNFRVNNNSVTVEDNQVGYFQLTGNTNVLDVQLYGANGAVDAKALNAKEVKMFHRSNQNIHLYPLDKIEGTLYSVGNAYLYNKLQTVNVNRLYTGAIIYK